MRCWGLVLFQIRTQPTLIPGLSSGVAAIGAGAEHVCAVTDGGAARCFGVNSYGQLGDGTTTHSFAAVPVVGLASGVAAIDGGTDHTCALTTAGAVLCWGRNLRGTLGNGGGGDSTVPVAVHGLTSGVKALAAGDRHSCVVTQDGAVACWGSNQNGQLGDGTRVDRSEPIWVAGLGEPAVAVDAGDHHTCAVMESGNVVCWGTSWRGESGNAGYTGTFASISGLSGRAVSIATGFLHTCATTDAGELFCWGANDRGQLGDGRQYTTVEPVAVLPEPSTPTALLAGIALLSSRALRRRGAR